MTDFHGNTRIGSALERIAAALENPEPLQDENGDAVVLRDRNAYLDGEVKRLNFENERLDRSLKDYHRSLLDRGDRIKELEDESDKALERAQTAESLLGNAQKQRDNAQTRAANLEDRNAKMYYEVRDLYAKIEVLQAELDKAKAESGKALGYLTQDEIRALNAKAYAREEVIDRLEAERDEALAELEKLRVERDNFKSNAKMAEDNVRRFSGELDAAKRRITSLTSDRDRFRLGRDVYAAQLTEAERKAREVSKALLNNGILELPSDFSDVEQIQEYARKYDSGKKAHAAAIEGMKRVEQERDVLADDVSGLREALDIVRKQAKRVEKERDRAEETLKNLEARYANLLEIKNKEDDGRRWRVEYQNHSGFWHKVSGAVYRDPEAAEVALWDYRRSISAQDRHYTRIAEVKD